MKPLNNVERRKAFTRFLAFFVITTLVLIFTILSCIQVPFSSVNEMAGKLRISNEERQFAESFSGKVEDTRHLLDSVNRAEVQAELVDGQISENLKKMNAMIDEGGSNGKTLYHGIVQNLADLQFAKKQLRNASGKDVNLSENMKQIEALKNELSQAKAEANTLRLQIMSQQH